MAGDFTLEVTIARDDLKYLQEKNCNLCLSRDVQFQGELEPGNVVFSGVLSQDLGPHITLQWREEYQVYGTRRFEAGAIATVDTHTQDIEGGQVATLHKDGTFGISGYPQPGAPFSVTNQWVDSAYIGVSHYDAIINAHPPFFISPEVSELSTSTFLPRESYSVFWDTGLLTGSMFENVSDRFLFSFTPGKPVITLNYKDRKWATVG